MEGVRTLRLMLALPAFVAFTIATPAAPAQRQFLSGHIPAAIQKLHLQPAGRLPAGTRLSLVIALPLRNSTNFTELLREIYDPKSPQYHHYLTPSQIAARFGPSDDDYQSVIAFAQTNGFHIVRTHADHTLLTVQGTVADIERTFHLKMLVYHHPTEARTFYAPDTEPSLDLAVPLLDIGGLNNYALPRPAGHPGTAQPSGGTAASGSGPEGTYFGSDYRAAYVPGTSLTGSGQTVGLLELDGYYTNDIETYETNAGLQDVTLTNVLIDGATGTPSGDSTNVGEVSLDMEMVISMAPGISRLIVYEAPDFGNNWVDILKQMQEDDSAKQLSSSWTYGFDLAPADAIYQEMAMQGQSFFQCSGDDMAYYSGVAQWADDPNITIVGGTTLKTGSNQSWSSEAVWTNGDGSTGSGGGASSNYLGNYSIPAYQQGMNMKTNGGSLTQRNVPDVAMVAYQAWAVYDDGLSNWWYGTSIAAPLWAGFAALANQQADNRSEPTLGFLNPVLYDIGNGPLYTNCFHDITKGNNTDSNSKKLYFAVSGYDLCTGWGTPNGVNLINVLTQTPYIYSSTRSTNGAVTLYSLCVPGSTNLVLSATNLSPPIAWQPISTNVAGSNGEWQFTDTNAPSYKTRFFRILSY
ncbi:MAG TPA: S53 family peptidase [Candidatus Sulfotelmatobacter sp.]|nr:S53 family peptidase [Candidatus Sulfotelmatobacter sp.]